MIRLDTDLLGLQIVASDDASVVGEVDGLLVDDAMLKVVGFLADLGLYEASVLPFSSVHAIGNDAIIVSGAASLIPIHEDSALESVALREITVSDAKAITTTGRSVGTIGDFYVETETGEIAGLEFLAADQTVYPKESAVIPSSTVHRLGRDIVVLKDDYHQHFLHDGESLTRLGGGPAAPDEIDTEPAPETQPESGSTEPGAQATGSAQATARFSDTESGAETEAAGDTPAEENAANEVTDTFAEVETTEELPSSPGTRDERPPEPEPAAPAAASGGAEQPAADTGATDEDTFTSQQKHFLIGKRVLRRIEGPSGDIIAEEGDLVTFEMIQKAKNNDQLLILSLNVE